VDSIEGYIEIDEALAKSVDFALRVNGDSMKDAGILDGDLVLIEKRNDAPANGQIAAVIVTQMDTKATLKRFYHEGDHIRLEPANDSYPLLIIPKPGSSKAEIRARYMKTHPKRLIKTYPGEEPQIAGWVKALIREDAK
jgi:SOS-response transcriptional repressor LexA